MQDELTERWRDVDDFPGWVVSDQGSVSSTYTSRVLSTRVNQQGIVMVNLTREQRPYTRSLALLVAKAFLPTPDNDYENTIIHLNGDRTDCRADNLMWRSRPFAVRYHQMFDRAPITRPVYIEDTGETFDSFRDMCTTYGLIERDTYLAMSNNERTFPYGWLLLDPDKFYDR